MHKLKSSLKKARHIIETEGLASFIRRGVTFLRHSIFLQDTYYIYDHILEEKNEADFLPRLQNFTLVIAHNNQQADELSAQGYEFRSQDGEDHYRLDKGAIAFCVFSEGELAHKGWAALTEEAQKAIVNLPVKIDFSAGESFCGGTLTVPKFRQRGLMAYGYFEKLQYLREIGRTRVINCVAEDNIASHRAMAKLHPKLYAKAHYVKFSGLRFWKEVVC
ncbi:MAG: hypothetical protein JSV54_02370 [Chloroflexota bacterium]|nr:MAG: hypothetical protein JSV54_02370 [Chloroflexota bacterium]